MQYVGNSDELDLMVKELEQKPPNAYQRKRDARIADVCKERLGKKVRKLKRK